MRRVASGSPGLQDCAPLVGDPEAVDTQALLKVVRDGHSPLQIVALGSPHGQRPGHDGMQLAKAHQLPSNAADRIGCVAAGPLVLERSQGAAGLTPWRLGNNHSKTVT